MSSQYTIKLPKRQKFDDTQIDADLELQTTDVPNDTGYVDDLSIHEMTSLSKKIDDINLFDNEY